MGCTSKMEYQETINNLFAPLNESKAVYPPYPLYHKGPYLEEKFVQHGKKEGDRYLIPVFWTNLYKEHKNELVQNLINKLDPTKKYYCVCTHDDAPLETLPSDTLVFRVGTRHQLRGSKVAPIQIPCTASPVPPRPVVDKDIPVSFIGSYTHPIREEMLEHVNKDYTIMMKPQWTEVIPEEHFKIFHEVCSRSKFILCPRGYAATSVRMYEAIQYGAVPVYISDEFITPWDDDIDWDKLVIKVPHDKLSDLSFLIDCCSDKRLDMVEYGKSIYNRLLSMHGVFDEILRRAAL